ncbi:hypothetical protein [Chryseobacterium indologenes]|uniref:hypothetical protein n=1 Tax=Chryseobacterium indologenes TaxID=253 RepID=UPI003D32EFFF
MINHQKIEDLYFSTEYKISSYLGDKDSDRFCQNIRGELIVSNEVGNSKAIGRLMGEKLLIREAINHNWDSYSIFDTEARTLEIGETVYNFDEGDWNDAIMEKFKNDIYENDLLILSRIEILPEYRGKGIGQKWIKDFYINFIQGCGLMALKVFPLQCESDYTLGRDQLWCNEMGYNSMNKNDDAFESLLQFYLKTGFELFPDISNSTENKKPLIFLSGFLFL